MQGPSECTLTHEYKKQYSVLVSDMDVQRLDDDWMLSTQTALMSLKCDGIGF